MFKTDSFLGNKKLGLNQNVWRNHATMQLDVLLHYSTYTYYGQNFIFWKAVLHLLLQHYTLATMHCTVTVTNGVGTIDTSSDGILDIKIKPI